MTTFKNKCAILADVWHNYRNDKGFREVTDYYSIGFPLAYAVDSEIIKANARVTELINFAFKGLLEEFAIEDKGYKSVDSIIREWKK